VTTPSWARADHRHDGPPDNLNDYANFVGALAQRYKGRVKAYEIWNEQNFSREWGGGQINPGAYVEMLKVAYARIKAADPNALVVSGALTPTGVMDMNVAVDDKWYLEQMYQYQGGVLERRRHRRRAHGRLQQRARRLDGQEHGQHPGVQGPSELLLPPDRRPL
jgi:hypothetical protein